MLSRGSSIRLFRALGIEVFLHWSWFFVAYYEISARTRTYSSVTFNILEYLGLFVIVLLHEFGHALACRQVGGTADRIVLWPLGGVAYVNPPQRPGATLWSIVAGPLVNVVLFPILYLVTWLSNSLGSSTDIRLLLGTLLLTNSWLLILNVLPIYPLDGGQILRSLLWFVMGRARSLMTAVVIGFLGVAVLILLAIREESEWFGFVALFILINCWNGWKQARALLKMAKLPRRDGFSCPQCHTAPMVGPYWKCAQCQQPFDTFASSAVCPQCRAQYSSTRCLDCGAASPTSAWIAPVPAFSGR